MTSTHGRRQVGSRLVWLGFRKMQKKQNPVNRREQRVFQLTENEESNNGESRAPEVTAGSNSQSMTHRKKIRVRQPVSVFAHRRSALRTKVCQRTVGRETAVAQRGRVVLFDFRCHSFSPRIGAPRACQPSAHQQPNSITTESGCGPNADLDFWAARAVTDLTEGRHTTLDAAALLRNYGSATSPARISSSTLSHDLFT